MFNNFAISFETPTDSQSNQSSTNGIVKTFNKKDEY